MKQLCTSIDQSQKLLELGLSPNTADMYYQRFKPKSDKIEHNPKVGNPVEALSWYNKGYTAFNNNEPLKLEEHCIPAWSLSALMILMPTECCLGIIGRDYFYCSHPSGYTTDDYDEPVEAAYNMIIWLIENNNIKKDE